MLSHYLFVAALSFRKAPLVALANVTVLALGLTAFVATYAVTEFWSRAERQFSNSQRTFIVSSRIEMSDGSVALHEVPATNPHIAGYVPTYLPRSEAVARAKSLDRGSGVPVSASDRAARLLVVTVDADFLSIFDLPFVAGDARSALAAPRSVVLTESTAERLFGAVSPLGLTVSLANRVDATVTGVVESIPEPSHMARSAAASLPFDMLASMDLHDAYFGVTGDGGPQNWFGIDGTTYVLLPADQSVTAADLEAALDSIVGRFMPAEQASFANLRLGVLPVDRMLELSASGMFLGGRGSITDVLWLLGSLVLGVACINYASLATARAAGGAHEVGVRKAIGANEKDVLVQHLIEAGLLTLAALAIAMLLVHTLTPIVEAVWGIDMSLALSAEWRFLVFIVALASAVTMLAGAYPAFVLSRVRPIFALRAFRLRGGYQNLLMVLVGIQFAAASFLSIAVAVIYLQNAELRKAGRAIATDPLLIIENRLELTGLSADILRDELLRLPQVLAVTAAAESPLSSSDAFPIARSADEGAPERMLPAYWVANDFASVLDLALLAGRFFAGEQAGDRRDAPAVVIDRSAGQFLGFTNPADAVGEVIYVPKSFVTSFRMGTSAQPLEVIGVVEDKPLAITGGVHRGAVYRAGAEFPFAVARISRDDVAGTLEQIDNVWARLAPGIAIDRRFADEILNTEYAQYSRIANAMTALCSFAVLIAVIGLFAMTQVVVARRFREIAMRKILGAKTSAVILDLLRGFALLVLAAIAAAWPLAFIAMRNYLDRFARPIELDAALFVACCLGMLLVAALTVGGQVVHAARARPSEALRHE